MLFSVPPSPPPFIITLLEKLRHPPCLKPSNRAQKLFLTKLQIFVSKSYTLTPSIPLYPGPSALPLSTPFSPKYSNLPRSTRLYPNYFALAPFYPDYPRSPRSTPFYSKYLNPRPPYSTLTKINSNQIILRTPSLFTFAQNISPLASPTPLSPKLPFFAFISSTSPLFPLFQYFYLPPLPAPLLLYSAWSFLCYLNIVSA